MYSFILEPGIKEGLVLGSDEQALLQSVPSNSSSLVIWKLWSVLGEYPQPKAVK